VSSARRAGAVYYAAAAPVAPLSQMPEWEHRPAHG